MALQSLNPATGEVLATYDELTDKQLSEKIDKAQAAFLGWKNVSYEERGHLMVKAGELFKSKADRYATVMTKEMGKPITQAIGESEKCAWVCDFYAEKAAEFLAPEMVETDASESMVRFDPLGIVLAVMPWNYPFWQVVRAFAPALMAGNVMLLKHASNVPECGMLLEEILLEAGFPEGVFQYLAIGSRKVAEVLDDDRVKAATLTGSEYAGGQVASQCGRQIKKTVLELGGSGPFIVLDDADIEAAAEMAVSARFQNCGQSCIAAKRFIVMDSVYDEFVEKFKDGIEAWKFGDPTDAEVQIGPMYAKSGLDEIESQVDRSVEMGARVVTGAGREGEVGAFYKPTILADVTEDMPVFNEETFGPVAAIMKVLSEKEAVSAANNTRFGLGSSLWTSDMSRAKKIIVHLDFGSVFVNGLVKSDPRLPFGGINKSGFGRELSHYGIREFVNVKTVWIK